MIENWSLVQIVLTLAYLALVSLSIKPVLAELRNSRIQHLVFGASAALSVLWWFRTGIYPGLEIHFLWLTATTLMLGWRWALLSSCFALLVITVLGHLHWQDLGVNGLIGCALPIGLSYLGYILAFHHLPRHLFVYIFVCSFFVGAVCITAKMFVFGFYFNVSDLYEWRIVSDNYLILIPLLLFPEGLLNGMTITILTLYKPSWVKTFYDDHYLNN